MAVVTLCMTDVLRLRLLVCDGRVVHHFDSHLGISPQVKVPSHCCDLSCNVVASCGRSGIACSCPGVVLRSHKLAIRLL